MCRCFSNSKNNNKVSFWSILFLLFLKLFWIDESDLFLIFLEDDFIVGLEIFF